LRRDGPAAVHVAAWRLRKGVAAERPYLRYSRTPDELARTLESALDPRGVLNPGKML
jgi:FAD/FMN-containing dehydrogenase